MRNLMLGLLLVSFSAAAQEEPEAVFAKFHRAMLDGNVAEMKKYGTPGGAKDMDRLPPEQQKAMLEMVKKLLPATYTITGREGAGSGSMILKATGQGTDLMTGKPQPQYGQIRMVKMGNDWKVDKTSWNNRDESGGAGAPPASRPAVAQPKVQAKPPALAATPAPARPVSGSAGAVYGAPVQKKLGEAKAPCVYKPVMTQQDLDNCK
jgi:hypothetical protein